MPTITPLPIPLICTLLSILLIISCSSQNKVQDTSNAFEGFTPIENSTGSYTLYLKEQDLGNTYPRCEYYVVRTEDNVVVKEGTIPSGSIKWLSPTRLEVLDLKGVIQSNQNMDDFKHIIDLLNE